MKILKITLSIIILLSFILVGTPIKYNCIELNILIVLIGTIYIFYKSFIKKEKIINRKIDIVILIFSISPIIPLVFKTYISLQETLISIIKYISLFNLYIMLKDSFKQSDDWITNIIIVCGVILALLGIDDMTSQLLSQYKDILNLPNVINYENRMFSTLGYANSFAIIMATSLLFSISKCQIKKEIYSGVTFLFLSTLLLSYSRSVVLIFLIVFITYIFFSKNEQKIYLAYIFTFNLIFSFIYMKLFENLLSAEHFALIWLTTVILFIISIMVAKLVAKKYELICKIKTNTYIKLAIFIVVLIGIFYLIGKNLDVPLKIFLDGELNDEVRYNIYNITPNQHYSFTFDITAKSKLNNIENYSIKIIEENKYYDTVKTHEITFNNFTGIKTIEFTASAETHSIAMLFNNNIKAAQNGLTINSLYINEDKYILDYLYLPVRLVNRIDNFFTENKSLWERMVFYKDGLKLANKNFITGTGGKGWLYNYENVQSYVYSTTEVHNYFLQVFVENGIISLLTLIIITLYSIIYIFKRFKNRKVKNTDFAFILLVLHSFIDFDMSFYCIMILWIALLAITLREDDNNFEKSIKTNKKTTLNLLASIILIIFNFSTLSLGIYSFKIKKDNDYILTCLDTRAYQDENEAIELIKNFSTNEKYNKFYYILQNINYQNISIENIGFIYDNINNQEIIVNTKYNMERNLVIKQILETCDDKVVLKNFSNIILEENDNIIDNIKDTNKNRLTEKEIENYLNLQQEIYTLASQNI